LQLAAYAEQLTRLGIPVGPVVHLILGNGEPSHHKLDDILPVFRDRLARLHVMVRDRLADAEPIAWGAPGTTACGRCDWRTPEVERTRDVILVAGMRTTQRARLAEAGIRTIDELAASTGPVEGIGDLALEKLRAQARMQLRAPEQAEG